MQKYNRSIIGISLLEIMLVLSIIAAMLVVATRYYNLSRENLRVTQGVDMVKAVASASYKWVAGEPNFVNLTSNGIQVLVNDDLLPNSYTNANANPWQGHVTASPIPTDTGDNVSITLTNIPEKSCNGLVAALQSVAAGSPGCSGDPDNQTFSVTFAKPE